MEGTSKREIESVFKGSVGHVGGKKDGTGNSQT